MRMILFVAALLATTSARADVALVLTDQERAVVVSLIAAGLQAQPQLSPQAVYLLNKINTAPTVTSQKPVAPDEPTTKPSETKP